MKMDMTLVRAEISSEYVGVHFLVQYIQDANQVAKLVQEIIELAKKFTTKRVVINFSGLQHLTSAFLAKLVSLNKTLGEMGAELRLCSMNKEIDHAFRLCKLHKLIKIFAIRLLRGYPLNLSVSRGRVFDAGDVKMRIMRTSPRSRPWGSWPLPRLERRA